jgi:uncharacterized membrane protein YeaQ/YmgE (transglycosylase-associated protein family)
MNIIIFLISGLIIGTLARLIVSGREPGGWVVSIAIGVAGSVAGGMIGRAFGLYRYGEGAGFMLSLAGAVGVVVIYHIVARGRRAGASTNV